MKAPEQIEKQIIKIYWTCGADTCRTSHTSEGSALRCPQRATAVSKERGYCLQCGRQYDRELPGSYIAAAE